MICAVYLQRRNRYEKEYFCGIAGTCWLYGNFIGAGDAVSDVVGGVTSGVDDITGDNDNTVVPGDTDRPAVSDSVTSDVSSETVSDNSGVVGGISVNNPTTGVTYGLTAGAAVLAAVGIAVTAVRKDK